MNITTKTTSMSMTPAITSYLEKKLKMISKYVDLEQDNVFIHVILGKISQHHKSGEVFKAEIDLHIGGQHYHAEAEKEDLYAAIDEVKDDIAREIKSGKDKRVSLVRRGAKSIKNLLKGF